MNSSHHQFHGYHLRSQSNGPVSCPSLSRVSVSTQTEVATARRRQDSDVASSVASLTRTGSRNGIGPICGACTRSRSRMNILIGDGVNCDGMVSVINEEQVSKSPADGNNAQCVHGDGEVSDDLFLSANDTDERQQHGKMVWNYSILFKIYTYRSIYLHT